MGKRATGDGDEGQHDSGEGGNYDEGPLEDKRKGGLVKNEADHDSAGQLKKLLESHVANQAKFIRRDVLGDRMLLHRAVVSLMLLREVVCASLIPFHKNWLIVVK